MNDRFLLFAYGSNMLTRRLRDPKRAPSAVAEGMGYVLGYRLTFDKTSKGNRQRSGKCDMEATGNGADRVYGVLFSISRRDENGLDREEGVGRGYRKDTINVVTSTGTKRAVVYIATHKDPNVRPYHWYKDFVVRGAEEHGLPHDYIERIRAVPSQADPDAKRRAANEAILAAD
jgi:hypothetical protein